MRFAAPLSAEALAACEAFHALPIATHLSTPRMRTGVSREAWEAVEARYRAEAEALEEWDEGGQREKSARLRLIAASARRVRL